MFQTMESQHTHDSFHICFKQWKANTHITAFTYVSNNGKPTHTWQLSHMFQTMESQHTHMTAFTYVSNNGKPTHTWQLSHVSNNGKPTHSWQLSHVSNNGKPTHTWQLSHVSINGKPTHAWQLSHMFQTMESQHTHDSFHACFKQWKVNTYSDEVFIYQKESNKVRICVRQYQCMILACSCWNTFRELIKSKI